MQKLDYENATSPRFAHDATTVTHRNAGNVQPVTPAELIASRLSALPLPDGGTIGLPGFQTRLLPAPMQEQIGATAREVGEGIVYLLTSHGYRVAAGDEPEPAPAGSAPIARLACRTCGTVLLELSLVDPARIVTDGPALLSGLAGRSVECPHGRV